MRWLKNWESPPDVLTVKGWIDVEGPRWKKTVYMRLKAVMKSFNRQVKSMLGYGRLTW